MADISRQASPICMCREDSFDVKVINEYREKALKELHKRKTQGSFMVGSIEKVNDRICDLNNELSTYDFTLAHESRASQNDPLEDGFVSGRRSSRRVTKSSRRRERRDIESINEHFSTNRPDTRKIMNKSNAKPVESSDAPRLVELQQYPGFHPAAYNPLPHSLAASTVLDRVLSAQVELKETPVFYRQFKAVMHSRTQICILKDVFWWVFVNKYHPDEKVQSQLFKRVACNFVQLYLAVGQSKFKDVFFLKYANLLAQAVYCAFCLGFPQSWRHFDDAKFKDVLVSTTYLWICGIKPVPYLHQSWNYAALEPGKMRKDDKLGNDGAKPEKKSKSPFGRMLSSTNTASSMSMSTKTGGNLSRLGGKSRNSSGMTNKKGPSRLDTISSAVSSRKSVKTTARGDSAFAADMSKEGRKASPTKLGNANDQADEESVYHPDTDNLDWSSLLNPVQFTSCRFNIDGRSPLINEYLHQQRLGRAAGLKRIVKRTQIDFNTTTDCEAVLGETQARVAEIRDNFNRIYDTNMKNCSSYDSQQRKDLHHFNVRCGKLLSKKKQVRYLSNLLISDNKVETEHQGGSDKDTPSPLAVLQTALDAIKLS